MSTKLVCPKCGGKIIGDNEGLDPVRCSKCKKVTLRCQLKEVKIK